MWIVAGQLVSALPQPPAWAVMWVLALLVFATCKCLSLGIAAPDARTGSLRLIGYVVAWPGLDAGPFLSQRARVTRPAVNEWGQALRNVLAGALLLWVVCPMIARRRELLIGWIGMIGLILLLHFGLFQMVALCWRRSGVDARPLMNGPLNATSLAEFWGRRWNTAFSSFTHRLIFRPLARRVDARLAVLVAFAFSGLIHDLVISVPARGGFGLPTGYFALQGLGILLERSSIGRVLRLSQGLRGRIYVAIVAGAPAFWLFHPPFVTRVIVPLLKVLGAVGN